jgi:hypothetical protein
VQADQLELMREAEEVSQIVQATCLLEQRAHGQFGGRVLSVEEALRWHEECLDCEAYCPVDALGAAAAATPEHFKGGLTGAVSELSQLRRGRTGDGSASAAGVPDRTQRMRPAPALEVLEAGSLRLGVLDSLLGAVKALTQAEVRRWQVRRRCVLFGGRFD